MADLRRADDLSIPPEENVYIRIPTWGDPCRVVEGGYRPTSGSIKHYPDEPISCDLASLCGPDDTRTRGTNGNYHVAVVNVGAVRELGLRVVRDPIPDGDIPNLAHAEILGSKLDGAKNITEGLTSGQFSNLARKARMILFAPETDPATFPVE